MTSLSSSIQYDLEQFFLKQIWNKHRPVCSMQLGCHRLISQDAPAGPQNAVEANGWLSFLVWRLGGVMVDRVIRIFEHSICGYSDFSGFDSWRVGVGKLFKMVSPSCEMHFLRACDVVFLQQDVLRWLSFELDRWKACLFPNLADRLPEESKSLIAAFTQTWETEPDSYDKFQAYLDANRKWLFTGCIARRFWLNYCTPCY